LLLSMSIQGRNYVGRPRLMLTCALVICWTVAIINCEHFVAVFKWLNSVWSIIACFIGYCLLYSTFQQLILFSYWAELLHAYFALLYISN
jgi:hypothetical protein